MKTPARILTLIAGALMATTSLAQPPDDFPPPQEPPMFGGEREPRGEPPFQPSSPLQRWMQQLKENDPGEFQRLQELRINDPKEFRAVTHAKLKEQGLQKLRAERPAIYEAIVNLPKEDRAWLADRLMRPHMGPPDRPPMDREGPHRPGNGPDIDRTLIREYHQSDDPEIKAGIRAKLRDQLSGLYDEELDMRREQLAEAEQRISAIRSALEQGEQGKDEFIESKLSAWLDQAPPHHEKMKRKE